jgi:hypothetical protein
VTRFGSDAQADAYRNRQDLAAIKYFTTPIIGSNKKWQRENAYLSPPNGVEPFAPPANE